MPRAAATAWTAGPRCALALVMAASFAAASACGAEGPRDTLDAAWREALGDLAAKSRELGRDDLAVRAERWRLPALAHGERLFLPPGDTDQEAPSDDEVTAYFDRRLAGLRRRRGAVLFDSARSLAADDPQRAFQLLHEVLWVDPDQESVRSLLGYQRQQDGWVRFTKGEATRMRANSRLGLKAGHWRLRSEHFEIFVEGEVGRGQALAEEIEAVHAAWSQLFFAYWNDPAALARRLEAGQGSVVPPPRRHRVVLYEDRASYLAALQPREPRIDVTVGMYLPQDKTSYFYWDDDPPRGTWRHEVTHQLFSESRRVAPNAGLRRNFWLLEGIAMYMESVRPLGGYCRVGGPGVDRLQFARYRQAPRSTEALLELVQMGRGDMQRSDRVSELYSEAAGLCCFLMDGEGARHRKACLQMLQLVYQDRDEAQNLFQVTGLDPDELLRRYRVFLADVDDEDLAQLGPVRNLCLKTTAVTGEGLAALDTSSLHWLDLTHVKVDDQALLTALGDAPRLNQLTLEGTEATDRLFTAAPPLRRRWPELRELDLSQTRIGDATVAQLTQLGQLEVLWLTATPVTDACVDDLLKLRKLKVLEIAGSGLTDAAVQRLRQGLPELQRLGR